MFSKTYQNKFPYIGIALSGAYATRDNLSLDSYDKRLDRFYSYLNDGGTVIDKRFCSVDDIYKYCISGALVKFALPDNTRQAFSEVLKPCSKYLEADSLDYVSFNLYVDFWRSRGARIGKRVKDSIIWENGRIEEIVLTQED